MGAGDATSTVTLEEGSVTVFAKTDPVEGTVIHLDAPTRAIRFEALETMNSWLSGIPSALQPRCSGPYSPRSDCMNTLNPVSVKSEAVQTPYAIEKSGAAEKEIIYSSMYESCPPVC